MKRSTFLPLSLALTTASLLGAHGDPAMSGSAYGHAQVAASTAAALDPVDLAIDDVILDRTDFRAGERVTVTALIRRRIQGGPVQVRCYVDTGRVWQVAPTVIVNGSDNRAVFNWTATYDAGDSTVIIGAYVEPQAGDPDLDNNGLWRVWHADDEGDGNSIKYAVPTHEYITGEAVKLANIPEVTAFAQHVVRGAVVEDNFPDLVYGVSWFFGLSTLWTRHFWDVDGGEEGRGLWGRESALEKGRAYLSGWGGKPGALDLYAAGNKALAYEYLGRMMHFVEDVSTPAHVHLDAHAIDDEEAEKWGHHHAQNYTFDMAGEPYDGDDYHAILKHAAQLADSLPSDDVEGDFDGFTDPGGWLPPITRDEIISVNAFGWDKVKPEGMKRVFDRTMPSAIAHAAGMIRLFWKLTHPGEPLPSPATKVSDRLPGIR